MKTAVRSVQYFALALIVIFAGAPFLWMFLTSLQPLKNLLGTNINVFKFSDASLAAYGEMFANKDYGVWLFNSILVCVIVVACNLVFDTLIAFPLARMNFRGKRIVLLVVLAGIMVPAQVILVPLYLEMRSLGWLNSYLALVAPYVASPTGIFLLRQHFMTLPKELDEAASMDGASRLRTLRSVLLPNSLAMLGTVAVLKFMWTWGEFAWPSLAVNSTSMRTIPVGLAGLTSQYGTAWDLLMAGSVLAVIPILLLFAFLQKYFVEGLTSGAVKG
jgi:ABC-type glycerol-3-phosphate transport system permease component